MNYEETQVQADRYAAAADNVRSLIDYEASSAFIANRLWPAYNSYAFEVADCDAVPWLLFHTDNALPRTVRGLWRRLLEISCRLRNGERL